MRRESHEPPRAAGEPAGAGAPRRPCPVCGGAPRTRVYRQRFATVEGVTFLPGYDVVVCDACGFGFADGIPGQGDFDRYYELQSKYETAERPVPVERLRDFDDDVAFIARWVPPSTAILEVGCGPGYFLRRLQERGYGNLAAVDPSQRCVEAIAGQLGIAATRGSVAAAGAGGRRYGLVLLLTVLEHVVDLHAAVAAVAGVQEAGGFLFVRVPDACRFADYDDSPFQQFSAEHVNYFSRDSAARLMGAHGYALVDFQEKALSESDTTVLPMLNLMFRKGAGGAPPAAGPDGSTAAGLARYVEKSRRVEDAIKERIAALARSGEPIVVWGVGTHTQRLLETGGLEACRIVAFIDSNPHYQGGTFRGVPVKPPEALAAHPEKVLVSSKVFQNEIARRIREELRASNELVLLYGPPGTGR